ncbi:SPOR domain-containing protein [Litorisediminicola beolgyonensis]|uniref:SPOR domain-containing protein n=1 Tax=Litorisediminicola beolgyonensis TaxID=1173614 RepID=A0ABW3ZL98_9RHOB
MADIYYEGPEAGSKRKLASWTNWVGAGVSLALVAGVGIWGTKLVMRDVSGIPVVQAAEGPMRVAPEQPGGREAEHQGLAVNAVAALGTAEDVPDELRLAPQPDSLAVEDITLAEYDEITTPPEVPDRLLERVAALAVPQPDFDSDPDAAIEALAAQIAAGIEPFSPVEAASDAQIILASASAGDAIIRPRQRPRSTAVSGLRTAALSAPAAIATRSTTEIEPETLGAGTRLVQLGAFDSAATARAEWARLETRFGAYLDDKARVVERAQTGGKTFYRLRAHGFDDLSDARRFCAAFVADGADCIPVVVR